MSDLVPGIIQFRNSFENKKEEYLDISRLIVYEEIIANNNTSRNPNTKPAETKQSAEEAHLFVGKKRMNRRKQRNE